MSGAAGLTPEEKFLKDKKTLTKLLRGAEYHTALKALTFAEAYHPGFRKDDMTPSFHHQIQIAFTAYNLRGALREAGLDPDRLIAAMILHDTYEDNQNLQIERVSEEVSPQAARDMVAMSKIRNGLRMDDEAYYQGLLDDPIWIIGKLLDRQNNVGTIFELKPAKQVEYVAETTHLVALAKLAVERHPEIEGIVQGLRVNLKSHLNLYLGTVRLLQSAHAPEVVHGLTQRGYLPAPAPSA